MIAIVARRAPRGNMPGLAPRFNQRFNPGMDKLRSLHYFAAAADEGSFSGAARRLEVSVPAVAKLIAALERELGTTLFERSPQGLALTASGRAYLEQSLPALEMLAQADEQARASSARLRGPVVVGVQQLVAMNVLVEALPRFHAMYPDIQLDLRSVTQAAPGEASGGIDVFLSLTWPEMPDMIHRRIGGSSFVVVASPEYLAAHGTPRHPRELEGHDCLLIRTQRGAVMDLWSFARGDEAVSVAVKGWMIASNALRDTVVRLAAAGQGVARILDVPLEPAVATGRLVRLLDDWVGGDAPPIMLSYWPSRRRIPCVRAFADFAADIFGELERRHGRGRVAPAPRWLGYRDGRASAIMRRVKATS
jgi:LysR family transcriptional regulator, regulator for bpeEF and oprC